MGNKTEKEQNIWKTKKESDAFDSYFNEWCIANGIEFDGDDYRDDEGEVLEYNDIEKQSYEDFKQE
jgi:uncharacterized protein YggL (DUF469 family)